VEFSQSVVLIGIAVLESGEWMFVRYMIVTLLYEVGH